MTQVTLTFTVTPEQIETVNFTLAQARNWILQTQPNNHELTPRHAAQIETFRQLMLNAFLQKNSKPQP